MPGPSPTHLVRELTVGARVVVRHRLPDGSATDALGDLVCADDTTLTVATRRGEVVVARADVLAAKAVPPPPARRAAPHAAIGVEDLERVMAEHWRPLERLDLGGWRLRASEGFTGRANSALAVGDPGVPLVRAVAVVEEFYAARGLRPQVAVAHEVDGPSGVADVLDARGWTVLTPTLVMTAATDDLPGARDASLPDGLHVETGPAPDDAWLAQYHYQGSPTVPAAGRRILVSADEQVFVRVVDGARTVAIARGSLSPGWAGVTAVETSPSHRRRGLGRRLLAEVADWARERGAASTYLQVQADNEAARALYAGQGFGVHHAYHYRVAP
ncbi:GNAT family N-acetyltransferase [Kineococcus rhizosphaerae]|uniref:Acetyltransferase (GNAT) family protein n=1 Tax=Kineococcus rhizosphaerae TaxID=559628 RepID=A0A2T0R463_9ACTN|nr:GNAT family N-acetyltransferase [Kineococcus rhizosphaerae]PRY15167.1 acetyltransferase (GNAT) family protein [Kineococcus rhizosphaerae]